MAWEDSGFPPWQQVRRLSGGSKAVEGALLALVRSARREPLNALLREQWGHEDAMERYVPRPVGGWRGVRSHGLVGAFLGGGAALASWPVFLLSLVARSAVLARIPEADTGWPLLFKESLALIDPLLADTIHAEHWPAEDTERHRLLCRSAGIILAYGSDATMESLRSLVPAATPLLAFGSRLSVAIVCDDMSLDEAALQLVGDAAIYDQGGCLSPQAVLVEGSPQRGKEFAALLDTAFAQAAADWLPAERPAAQASAIRAARDITLFEEDGMALGPEDLLWTVLYSARPSFEPSPLGRTIHVRTWQTEDNLCRLLAPYCRLLQAVGVGIRSIERRLDLAATLADLGVTRICPPGQMQFPPLSWSHDGHALLGSLVRFVDVEDHQP